jgi:hypothetical protein
MPSEAEVHVDKRASVRSSLLRRTAKVVCQSGEYLCLVRDVSAEGAGLSFFHPVPAEERIFLEMADGAIYPIERAWSRDLQAGYRFASPIDVARFIADRGEHPNSPIRVRLRRPVEVTLAGTPYPAELEDISRTGARFIADCALPLQAPVRLAIAGMANRIGHVLWRRGFTHGVVFQNPMTLDELALQLFQVQPFADSGEGPAVRVA